MSTLDALFSHYGTDKSSTNGHNYAYLYERYVDPVKVSFLLEIGIAGGASLRSWRDWCPGAEIHGIDLWSDPVEGCFVHIGDVTDPVTSEDLGMFDVIVDDGSHDLGQIERAFQLLWPHLSPNGWYVIEDLAPTGYRGGVQLFLHEPAWEVHRHGEIVFAKKAPR